MPPVDELNVEGREPLQESELGLSDLELLALPASVPVVLAGRAFGMGRNKAGELARAGAFPCPVHLVGKRYRVNRSALYEALGFDPVAARAALSAATARKADSRPAA